MPALGARKPGISLAPACLYLKFTPLLLLAALSLGACDNDDSAEEPTEAEVQTETLTPAVTTIRVADLPNPFASQSATNYPQVLAERHAAPARPAGLHRQPVRIQQPWFRPGILIWRRVGQ
jgi:hypothetical protein